jgi:glycosyltransferase involved in cell wall biosynthesis
MKIIKAVYIYEEISDKITATLQSIKQYYGLEDTYLLSIGSKNNIKNDNTELKLLNTSKESRGAAYNTLLDEIKDKDYDAILFIDVGITLTNNILEEFEKNLKNNIGIIGCKTVVENSDLIENAGWIWRYGYPIEASKHDLINSKESLDPKILKAVSSNCWLITKQCIDRVGKFDENLYNQGTDIDYCLRATLHMFKSMYLPIIVYSKAKSLFTINKQANDTNLLINKLGSKSVTNMFDDCKYYYNLPNYKPLKEFFMKENDKPKITCLIHDFGCGYYRIQSPYRELASRDYNVCIVDELEDFIGKWSDIVVMQLFNAENILEHAKKFKEAGKKIIYELDDYHHNIPKANYASKLIGKKEQDVMEQFIRLADVVTVTTDKLKQLYTKFNKNIEVIPNALDINSLPKEILKNETDIIRIGWTASGNHHGDIPEAKDALEQILDEFSNVKLVIIGADYRKFFGSKYQDRIEFITSTYHYPDPVVNYYNKVNNARLDIGIAPLERHVFNLCKSNIKPIEYSWFEIPSVLSSSDEYIKFVEESGTGYLCSKHIDWVKNLRKLILDQQLRKSIGSKSKEYCLNNYLQSQVAGDKLEQVINNLMEGVYN